MSGSAPLPFTATRPTLIDYGMAWPESRGDDRRLCRVDSLTGRNSQSSDTPSRSGDDSSLNRPGASHDDRHRDDADAILVGKVGTLRDIDGHDLLTL